jgi:uncharacterized surface protein with fasciclin (FAS1) repeats
MNRRSLAALAAIAALGLAACGDDADDAAPTTSAAAATTTSPASPSTTTGSAMSSSADTMADDAGTIVEVAEAAGDFTTLVAAVQAAGLAETLSGPGPFTVFAPADDAFAALPEGTVDTLLEDPTGDLAKILTYHVVAGEVLAADVVGLDGQAVTTVNGATLTVNVDGENVSLTDAAGNTANVVATDIEASNGVIHVIDAVVMPA